MKQAAVLIVLTIFYSVVHSQVVPGIIFSPVLLIKDTASMPLNSFSVIEKDRKALLRWRADSLPATESFFAVERSNNGLNFTVVGIIKTVSNGWNEFLDDSPPAGRIFYRVKLSTGLNSFYTSIIAASPAADVSCKFYPNPVDKVLIIKSEFEMELQITDQFGKVMIADKFAGGLKVIDVSSLEPGIYIITFFQKESGRQITEKLVKK